MNINIKSHKFLASVLFALGMLISTGIDARDRGDWRWHNRGWGPGFNVYIGPGPGYHRPFHYRPVYHGRCGWVAGHWRGRHWVPAHRVCWR